MAFKFYPNGKRFSWFWLNRSFFFYFLVVRFYSFNLTPELEFFRQQWPYILFKFLSCTFKQNCVENPKSIFKILEYRDLVLQQLSYPLPILSFAIAQLVLCKEREKICVMLYRGLIDILLQFVHTFELMFKFGMWFILFFNVGLLNFGGGGGVINLNLEIFDLPR